MSIDKTNLMINAATNFTMDPASYKKVALETWTRTRKIEKLAYYSGCQNESCKCNGWKNPVNINDQSSNNSESTTPLCKTCSHPQSKLNQASNLTILNINFFLGEHIKHYKTSTDAQINRLLQTALDVECLFSLICKEEDADSKHIYFFLFKVSFNWRSYLNLPFIMFSY
jgi:histone acetyltransferase